MSAYNKNKQKWIYTLFFYSLLAISIFLVVDIGSNLFSRYSGNRMYEELKDEKPVPPQVSEPITVPDPQETSESVQSGNLEMLNTLKEKNSDTIAWLEVPGTKIDYPVMQSKDNKYYLRKTFNKEYNILGSIFADYRNSPDFNDKNTVIYGHNMKDGSMFYDILLLKNQDFYNKNSKILITLDDRILKYSIFSVYEVNKDYDYRSPNYDENDFKKLLADFEAKSVIKSDITPSGDDKILTLSTCSYSFGNARLVAHAVLTDVIKF